MIMGSANTPESVMKYYSQMSLSKCSLNMIEVPSDASSYFFEDIFEYCVKVNNMIPIAVYKRHSDESNNTSGIRLNMGQEGNKNEEMNGIGDEKTQRKSYVWLHPPRKIELSLYDLLFVLCEKSEQQNIEV